MMKTTHLGFLIFTLFLSACVTINIYFPAAQAKEAAEKIVDDILQSAPAQPNIKGKERPPAMDDGQSALEWGTNVGRVQSVLDFFIPAAHAAQPNFSVESPEIRRLQASLKRRHGALAPFFRSGAIGFTQDGLVAVRDAKAVALRDRKRVNQLVAQENKDRGALYRAIANANGHPEWERDVRAVFARTWIEKAESGWFYRNARGQWARK